MRKLTVRAAFTAAVAAGAVGLLPVAAAASVSSPGTPDSARDVPHWERWGSYPSMKKCQAAGRWYKQRHWGGVQNYKCVEEVGPGAAPAALWIQRW